MSGRNNSFKLSWDTTHGGRVKNHTDDEGNTWRAELFSYDGLVSLKIYLKNRQRFITRLVKIIYQKEPPYHPFQKAFNFRLGKVLVFEALDDFNITVVIENTDEEVYSIPIPPPSLTKDLGSMLKGDEFSMVMICADSIVFNVHKTILINRCPEFEEIFNDVVNEESTDNVVKINDFDADTIQKMLHFIYTDQVNLQEEAQEKWITLYQAAGKYKLNRLKAICENMLMRRLTVESVVELLILADLYESHMLKEEVIHFIIVNSRQVLASEAWKRMLEEQYKLVNDFLLASSKIITNFNNRPSI